MLSLDKVQCLLAIRLLNREVLSISGATTIRMILRNASLLSLIPTLLKIKLIKRVEQLNGMSMSPK